MFGDSITELANFVSVHLLNQTLCQLLKSGLNYKNEKNDEKLHVDLLFKDWLSFP